MKKSQRIASFSLAALAVAFTSQLSAQSVSTDPVGFVTLNVTAGTGVAKKASYLSFPLYATASITGQAVGQITAVTSNTLSNTNAGWALGALSQPSTPFAIQITSGTAEGRIFLIAANATTGGAVGSAASANTATTVTISSLDINSANDPVSTGVTVGDTYRIIEVDTLSGVFGTPSSSGILGGSSAANADSIIMIVNGVSSTYFYNTGVTPNRWSRVASGNPDAGNTPILPYYGVLYNRLGSSALSFVTTGTVPLNKRLTQVKNSGVTVLAQYWPADSTLSGLGLQNVSGWLSGSTVSTSDNVILVSGGVASTYWYNGTNWRRQASGNPISDTTTIPSGAVIYINKRGATSGFSTLNQTKPYSL